MERTLLAEQHFPLLMHLLLLTEDSLAGDSLAEGSLVEGSLVEDSLVEDSPARDSPVPTVAFICLMNKNL